MAIVRKSSAPRTLGLVGLGLIWFVVASCGGLQQPTIAFKHTEKRGRIDANGFRFVVMPDPTTKLVEVDVRFDVGSREDPPGKAGLAHLVEHLLFNIKPEGPSGRSLKYFMDQIAVASNAYTIWDKTHYMMLARADHVDTLLQLEAMRLHYGCESITEAEFAREREVVRNEIRQRYGTPQGQIWPLVLKATYPEGHAYSRITGGDDMQVAALTLADACEFVRKYYTPDRATLIVAGNVDLDATTKLIAKWFGKIAPRTPAARAPIAAMPKLGGQRKTFKLDIERPVLVVLWPVPNADTAAGDAIEDAMIEAVFRTAFKAEEYEFATGVGPTGRLGGSSAATAGLIMELTSTSKVDQALEFTWKAARGANRLFTNRFAPFEEWRIRRQASLITKLEPLFGNEHRTDVVGDLIQFRREYDFGSPDQYVFRELDAIRTLSESAIRDAATAALDPAKAQVIVFEPSASGIKGDKRSSVVFQPRMHEDTAVVDVDPAEASRALPVADDLGVLAGAKWFTLGNGMRVALLPVEAMPIVTARLVFDVGKATAPESPLLADAAADLLQFKINPGWTAEDFLTQIPIRVSRSGIRIGCTAGLEITECAARGMNIYLDEVIQGLERLIKTGEYDQPDVESVQRRMRAAVSTKRAQQRNELERQRLAALLGVDHPYTKAVVNSKSAVGKLGRDVLFSFRDRHYSAANATLVVAGSFDTQRAESMIREHFGGWSRGHDDAPIATPPTSRDAPTFVGVVGEPGPQMTVSILYPSAAGIGGQHAARLILTEMLDARVAKIRERLGATYGVNAYRENRRGPSHYEITGTVDAARAGEALRAMREAVDSLRTATGADFDVDFARARRKIVSRLLAESNTSSTLADRLALIAGFGMPPDYFTTLLRQVAAAPRVQVQSLIVSELDPKREAVVTMADRPTLDKAFADAGIKDVKLIEP